MLPALLGGWGGPCTLAFHVCGQAGRRAGLRHRGAAVVPAGPPCPLGRRPSRRGWGRAQEAASGWGLYKVPGRVNDA